MVEVVMELQHVTSLENVESGGVAEVNMEEATQNAIGTNTEDRPRSNSLPLFQAWSEPLENFDTLLSESEVKSVVRWTRIAYLLQICVAMAMGVLVFYVAPNLDEISSNEWVILVQLLLCWICQVLHFWPTELLPRLGTLLLLTWVELAVLCIANYSTHLKESLVSMGAGSFGTGILLFLCFLVSKKIFKGKFTFLKSLVFSVTIFAIVLIVITSLCAKGSPQAISTPVVFLIMFLADRMYAIFSTGYSMPGKLPVCMGSIALVLEVYKAMVLKMILVQAVNNTTTST